jgi:hypothetical protein
VRKVQQQDINIIFLIYRASRLFDTTAAFVAFHRFERQDYRCYDFHYYNLCELNLSQEWLVHLLFISEIRCASRGPEISHED